MCDVSKGVPVLYQCSCLYPDADTFSGELILIRLNNRIDSRHKVPKGYFEKYGPDFNEPGATGLDLDEAQVTYEPFIPNKGFSHFIIRKVDVWACKSDAYMPHFGFHRSSADTINYDFAVKIWGTNSSTLYCNFIQPVNWDCNTKCREHDDLAVIFEGRATSTAAITNAHTGISIHVNVHLIRV